MSSTAGEGPSAAGSGRVPRAAPGTLPSMLSAGPPMHEASPRFSSPCPTTGGPSRVWTGGRWAPPDGPGPLASAGAGEDADGRLIHRRRRRRSESDDGGGGGGGGLAGGPRTAAEILMG